MFWPRLLASALLLLALLFVAPAVHCQTCVTNSQVTLGGTLRGSNGIVAKNYIFTIAPSQQGFIAGCGVNLPTTFSCATSTDGSVVGVPNPLTPSVNSTSGSGSLPSGVYYTVFEFYDGSGNVTLPSPETRTTVSVTGSLVVNPPASGVPSTAAGMKVFIGTTSGGETLQGTTTGSASYVQSVALVSGASPATSNSTLCKVTANDAIWPVGTGYNVSLVDSQGNPVPQYPMQWQLLGPGTTYDLSNGLPYYHGVVFYPVPILAQPANHGAQSISGPLSMGGYNVYNVGALGVGTGTPGYGVDVEGAGVDSEVNALGGYLVNGGGGSAGQCLGSDGTAYDTPIACVTSIPTLYYQTIEANGSAETQRAALNFSPRFLPTDSSSPARTNVDLNSPGTGYYVGTYTADPGGSTNCAAFDGNGNLVPSSSTSCAGPTTTRTCNSNGCYRIEADGTIEEWGQSAYATGSGSAESLAITFPHAFTTTTHLEVVVSPTVSPSGDGNPHPLDCHLDATPSTSGATVILSIPTQIGGSGYDSPLLTSQFCSWTAWGN